MIKRERSDWPGPRGTTERDALDDCFWYIGRSAGVGILLLSLVVTGWRWL